MLDIKWIRENPDLLDQAMQKRFAEPIAKQILLLDKQKRDYITSIQQAQEERNNYTKEIGKAIAVKDITRADGLKKIVSELKNELSENEALLINVSKKLNDLLDYLPNIPLGDVPLGKDENDNIEIHKFLEPTKFDFEPKSHYELGENLGSMNFTKAAQIAGSRFTILKGSLALLERALGQFMLDIHVIEHNYQELSVPLLVRDKALYATAQLPKFAEDLFKTTDNRWLIPTGEVPLTNIVYGEILNAKTLPLRFTALTPCFRSEAGAAGKDTRGMLRQHQFSKVELVSITTPEQGEIELKRMLKCAQNILEKLNIPYRTMLLCSGDMGFAAQKTYDIEAWMPGQNTYREISSCSLCGSFQARRMGTRYKEVDQKHTTYVNTLNGSGVAVGRCLIAVLENYQQKDGSIIVPEVLRPYMRGIEVITAN